MNNLLNFLFVTSFRYCLGRRTYIVSEFYSHFNANIDKLSYNTLMTMKKEILSCKDYGMSCDKEIWDAVLDLVLSEIVKRITEKDGE